MSRTLLFALFSLLVGGAAAAQTTAPAPQAHPLRVELETLVAEANWAQAAALATDTRGETWCAFEGKQANPDGEQFRTLAALGVVARYTNAPELAVECMLDSLYHVGNDGEVARGLFDLGSLVENNERAAQRLHQHLDVLTRDVGPSSQETYLQLQHFSREALGEVPAGALGRATAKALFRRSFEVSPSAIAARRGGLSAREVQEVVARQLPQPFAVSHQAASLHDAKAWAVEATSPREARTRWYRATWKTVHATDALVLHGVMLLGPDDPEDNDDGIPYGSTVRQVVIVKPAKSTTYYVLLDPTVYWGPDRGSAVVRHEVHDLHVAEGYVAGAPRQRDGRVSVGTYGFTQVLAHSMAPTREESAIACEVLPGKAPVCVRAHADTAPMLFDRLVGHAMQFKMDAMSQELRATVQPYHGGSVAAYVDGLPKLNATLAGWVRKAPR